MSFLFGPILSPANINDVFLEIEDDAFPPPFSIIAFNSFLEYFSKTPEITIAFPCRLSFVFMIFTLGSIGLPGTSGFVGEFLILMGTFKKSFLVATIASLGVVLVAAYMLWLYRRIIFGELIHKDLKKMLDLNKSEIFILWSLAIPILFFGFYPEPLINTIEISVNNLIEMYNSNLQINLAENN